MHCVAEVIKSFDTQEHGETLVSGLHGLAMVASSKAAP